MGFVRKHFAWLIMGVVLLGEIAALWFVTGKQSAAETARENLEKLREQRDKLEREIVDIDKRIDVHKDRKRLVRRELGDCALFLWHTGQAIEGLFESPELAPYRACPWETPPNFEVFKIRFDTEYHAQAKALTPLMDKVGTDPAMLAFADVGALAAVNVLIGDVFAMQKEFWVKKELVQILAAAEAELLSITYGSGAAGPARHLPAAVRAAMAAGPGKLAEEIPIQFSISCNYLKLHGVLDALLGSRLCLRIESVAKVSRSKVVEKPAAAPAPPKGAPAGKAPEAPAPQPERREYVTVDITGHVADITMDVQSVLFPARAFERRAKEAEEKAADKAKVLEEVVKQWLDEQLRRTEARLKLCEVPDPTKRPEKGLEWVARELGEVGNFEKAAPPAPDKALPPVNDELFGEGREYVFPDVKAARLWLNRRYDFERAKLEAYAALWRRTRAALDGGKGDEKSGVGVFTSPEGITVALRPAAQFDANQWYEADFVPGERYTGRPDPKERDPQSRLVQVKLGLVTFKPRENRDVRRAVKAAGR